MNHQRLLAVGIISVQRYGGRLGDWLWVSDFGEVSGRLLSDSTKAGDRRWSPEDDRGVLCRVEPPATPGTADSYRCTPAPTSPPHFSPEAAPHARLPRLSPSLRHAERALSVSGAATASVLRDDAREHPIHERRCPLLAETIRPRSTETNWLDHAAQRGHAESLSHKPPSPLYSGERGWG
jgi:hypothetical protein